jgi:hypothetical protein
MRSDFLLSVHSVTICLYLQEAKAAFLRRGFKIKLLE